MRGSEAIRHIRERERAGGSTTATRMKIVSCTGNAEFDVQKLRDAGADAVWCKPFPSFTDGSMQKELAALLL